MNADFFDCLALTSLRLSTPYCATGVLELTAAHAPNVKRVEAYQYAKSPYIGLTHFKALLVPKVHCCRENESSGFEAFDFWLLLESLDWFQICQRSRSGSYGLEVAPNYLSVRIRILYSSLPLIGASKAFE